MANLCAPSWRLDATDPTTAADALVALCLIRCARALPGQLPARCHDDVGAALAPVIDSLAPRLKGRLASAVHGAAYGRAGRPEPSSAVPAEGFEAVDHAEAIGAALNRDRAGLRPVFDAAEQVLDHFVRAHPHAAARNVAILAGQLSLTTGERAFLDLAAAACLGTLGRDLFGFVNTPMRLRRVMTQVFGADPAAPPMLPGPALRELGLLALGGRFGQRLDLDDLLELTGVGERLLCTPVDSPQALAALVLRPLPTPEGAAELHWPHLAPTHAVARAALKGALEHEACGFNLLVHGAPGTGKTAFVHQLVRGLGAQGHVVDHADEDGREASRADRLASLLLCQSFTRGQRRVVLVLDEAEDVFPWIASGSGARRSSRLSGSKAWTNDLLEHNRHPVIWISNRVDQLDAAYLRRFALCVGFPQTPYPLRRQIAQQRLAPLAVTPTLIERVTASELMSPALLDNAARLVRLACQTASPGDRCDADDVVAAVLEGHAAAAGQPTADHMPRPRLRFDAAYLRLADGLDAEAVLDAMRDEAGASLLFHGPPGTGKTQFASELAHRLGRRLVVQTASDINSPWYGQSEAKVARLFTERDPRAEVLLLDEAEVLLGARITGSQRADRAVTAEFLRWLECFDGVFVCATNHPECIDPALQRRFVLRVGFLPLDAAQRVALLAALAVPPRAGPESAADALDEAQAQQVRALEGLTAGDYANVARRLKRRPADVGDWLRELALELRAKSAHRHAPIGFV